jgi:hypothetical protein
MNNNINIRLNNTRNEIWELLNQYYNLTHLEYSRLKYEYEYHFGSITEKIDYYKKLEEKINQDYSKFQSNDQFRINSIDKSQCQSPNDLESKNDDTASVQTNQNVRKYYIDLVKYLHPDVSDVIDDFMLFWDQIQDSYKNSDEFRLELYWRLLINKIENQDFADNDTKNLAIENEINILNFKIQKIKILIKELYSKEPYVFADKINDKLWRLTHRRELESKLFYLKRKFVRIEPKLAKI